MFTETQKLHLIEEVLKTADVALLRELETVVSRARSTSTRKAFSAHDFAGIWSKTDVELIENAIKDGCEQINEDGWK